MKKRMGETDNWIKRMGVRENKRKKESIWIKDEQKKYKISRMWERKNKRKRS
jgi:hypothetical protein